MGITPWKQAMPNNLPRLAAVLLACCSVAACDHTGNNSANLALNDTSARSSSSSARDGTPLYPSSTPAPAGTSVPAPRVDPLSREALSDPAITSRIKTAIVTDPQMAGADVSVNTDGGVVSLTGTVKSQEQAAVASSLAQRNDGVMRIDNHLSTLPQ
jgi:hypothetical protein